MSYLNNYSSSTFRMFSWLFFSLLYFSFCYFPCYFISILSFSFVSSFFFHTLLQLLVLVYFLLHSTPLIPKCLFLLLLISPLRLCAGLFVLLYCRVCFYQIYTRWDCSILSQHKTIYDILLIESPSSLTLLTYKKNDMVCCFFKIHQGQVNFSRRNLSFLCTLNTNLQSHFTGPTRSPIGTVYLAIITIIC